MNRVGIENTLTHLSDTENTVPETLTHEQLAEMGELYRSSYAMMINIAKRAGARDPEATLHTAWEKALKNWNSYQDRGKSRQAWLYRIVRNTVFDEHRRSKDKGTDLASDSYEYIEYPDVGDDYEALIGEDLTARALGRVATLLDSKPDFWKKIVALRLEGFTNTEIGEKLDIKRATIATAIFRMNKLFAEDDELLDLFDR